jgi:hypothetical protein
LKNTKQKSSKHRLTVPIPHTVTPDGPRLILLRPSAYDPNKYGLEDISRIGIMLAEMMMLDDDNFVVAGQVRNIFFFIFQKHTILKLNPLFSWPFVTLVA